MAKRTTRGSSTLNATAETPGTALGHIAARVDRWMKDRAAIAADIEALSKSAQTMLADFGDTTAAAMDRARKGGRPKGYKMSDATKAKLRAAWKRRKAQANKT